MFPSGKVTGRVAGLVQTRSRLGAEGVWNELFSGQIRSVQIAPGQACSADVQFTGNSNRNRAAVFVEDVVDLFARGRPIGNALKSSSLRNAAE